MNPGKLGALLGKTSEIGPQGRSELDLESPSPSLAGSLGGISHQEIITRSVSEGGTTACAGLKVGFSATECRLGTRSASQRKPLSLPRLRFGLLCESEKCGLADSRERRPPKYPKRPSRSIFRAVRARVIAATIAWSISSYFAAAAFGQRSPPPPTGQAASALRGDAVLDRAIRRLQSYRSVVVETRQVVDLLGKRLNGSGSYWERRDPGWVRFRLEMTIRLAQQQEACLVQVCDGRHLWTYRRFRDDHSMDRVNVDRVRQAWEESGRTLRPAAVGGWPGPGGLANMLSVLNSTFDFPVAQPVRLAQEEPGWKLEGTWKPGELAEILPDRAEAVQRGESPDLSRLPAQLPGTVVLWLTAKDLFPRRIEYRRPDADDDRAGDGSRLIMSLDFHHVELNVPVRDSRFLYNPGDPAYTDRTQEFIENMGIGRQERP